MRNSPQLAVVIDQMLQSGTPLSFYDALLVVRRARQLDELPDAALARIIRMHDLPRTTDGAREILADFLRVQAERHAAQRSLAARPITVGDNGKTARAPVRGTLTLELAERRPKGYLWQIDRVRGPGSCARRGHAPGDPPRALFDVTLNRTGILQVTLTQRRPAQIEEEALSETFELRVIVEPR